MKELTKIFLLATVIFACSSSIYAQNNPFADDSVIINKENQVKYTAPGAVENIITDIKEADKSDKIEFKADSKLATSFLYALKGISDSISDENKNSNKWYWSNSNNKRTFESQKKSKKYVCNNALFVVWGLAECGVFKNNEKFYTRLSDGKLIWNTKYSDTKKSLLKHADLIKVSGTAKKLIDSQKVKAGDICCSIGCGTFVYAGGNMWFDASRNGCESKVIGGKYYYENIYSSKGHPDAELTYVIRLKDATATATQIAVTAKEKTSSTSSDTKTGKNLEGFLASLQKISDIIKKEKQEGKPWFYSNTKNKNTMEAQRKSGRKCCNCALMVVWALADCGVFHNNEKFYGAKGGEMAYRNGAKKTLEKYCTITHPNKTAKQLIKEGKLREGDICCYPIQHTNVYAGNNKWWDAGRGSADTYLKGGKYYFNTFYTKKGTPNQKVTTLIRFNK